VSSIVHGVFANVGPGQECCRVEGAFLFCKAALLPALCFGNERWKVWVGG